MISVLHLFWIIPVSASMGTFVAAIMFCAGMEGKK